VKTDDPRLEKGRKEMTERIEKMDALTLAVLRSHLLAEQCMGDYLIANGKRSKWIKRQKFSKKMEWCKNLAKEEAIDSHWDVLNAANQLRNAIAHTLSAEEIDKKMQLLKDRYFNCLTEKQAADLAKQSDDYIAQTACVSCAGFIATLTASGRGQVTQ